VQIPDVLEIDATTPMMVMDLLDGESLGDRLERERALPVAEVAKIMVPVVSAVGTAHALGIVHRDLKPDNLFLVREADGSTTVKVLDFGIAKLTATEGEAAETGALTKTGSVLGTPYYMSPEQAFGEKDLDYRSDIWAVGIILYECLTGRRPTAGENLGQIFKAITTGGIVPLERAAPQLPPELCALVGRMLSRERAARPDLHEVRAVLQRLGTARAASFGPPAIVIVPPSGDGDALPSSSGAIADALLAGLVDSRADTTARGTVAASRPPPRRRTAPVIAIAAIVVAATALGAWRLNASRAPVSTPASTGATMTASAPPSPPAPPSASDSASATAAASSAPQPSAKPSSSAPARVASRIDAGGAPSAAKPVTSAGGPAGLADKPPF
jgi:serine/threonine-protein kinase